MATTILARYADGRLLVHHEETLERELSVYQTSGLRIPNVRHIEKVLDVGVSSGYTAFQAELSECRISGHFIIPLFRNVISGYGASLVPPIAISGHPAVTSGLALINATVLGW